MIVEVQKNLIQNSFVYKSKMKKNDTFLTKNNLVIYKVLLQRRHIEKYKGPQ